MHASPFFAVIGGLSVLIWTYLLLFHGQFWRVSQLLHPTAESQNARRIAVVVPARNEADVVRRTIASLLAQSVSVHVFLVDDGSSDGTPVAARAAGEALGKSDRLTVIPGQALPPGWSGKLWAVQQGVEHALELNPDYLLLTDADVVHAENNVAELVATAEAGAFDLTSSMVQLHCAGWAEKLLIPAFVFFFFKLYPPRWIANLRRRTAGAAGGCMLVRPAALARAGGIAAVRGEIIDDCALARAIKRTGGRVQLGLTRSAASIRPYGSFGEIGRMIARTAFNQLGHSWLVLIGALAGLALTYLAPLLLLFSGHAATLALGALAWLLMSVAYMPMVRFYGLSPLWAAALPLSAAFYMGATVYSAMRYAAGRGGQWKGRAQDTRPVGT